jgi:Sec-independent protein translocase protein TatA
MKVNKLKEFFTKIDTDTGMDHRIKNKLLYYDIENIQEGRKRHYDRRYRKTFRESSSGRTIFRTMLPSLVILVFIAVILFGIRANLFRSASDPEDSMNAARRSAGQYSSDLATGSESVVDENGVDNSQEQSAVQATTEAVLNQDTTINESSGEKETTEIKDSDPLDTLQNKVTNTSVSESNGTDSNATAAEAFQSAESKATGGEFYFAWFDVITENNVKASIPNLIVRFHGSLDSMDPSDLTDIVLTRDGVPVDNSITFTGKVDQFKWSNEDITDFYFSFATDNREPGNYGLTGKYKGMTFTVYNKIIEAAVSDAAADPDELNSVSFCYLPDEKDKPKQITELVFNFNGLQNAFYQADLAELKLTCNDEELPVSFEAQVFRYYEANMNNTGDTSFNLVLKEPFTQSGTYTVTGKYQGVEFTSMEIVIP